MCCCGKPTVNGESGAYSWDGKTFGTRHINAPALADNDVLLFDEPGRCGRGIDSHCHHFRVVSNFGMWHLLVRHGGGDERVRLHGNIKEVLRAASSDDRYWLLQSIYCTQQHAASEAAQRTRHEWAQAIIDKRIEKKKSKGVVRVSIKEPVAAQA